MTQFYVYYWSRMSSFISYTHIVYSIFITKLLRRCSLMEANTSILVSDKFLRVPDEV